MAGATTNVDQWLMIESFCSDHNETPGLVEFATEGNRLALQTFTLVRMHLADGVSQRPRVGWYRVKRIPQPLGSGRVTKQDR